MQPIEEQSRLRLCMIAPRLPPAYDGIGDYCKQLWKHVRNDGASPIDPVISSRWCFIVMDGAEASQPLWPEVDVSSSGNDQEPSLSTQLLKLDPQAAVVLHYVGYGYAADGAPHWLNAQLRTWKAARPQSKLITMFHETWSSGKPWQRAFWHMPQQKRCVLELIHLTDVVVTSNDANLRSLRQLFSGQEESGALIAGKPVAVIPIGPNFDIPPVAAKNYRQISIFGKEHSRFSAIQQHKKLLARLSRERLIDRFVCAGYSSTPGPDPGEKLLARIANSEVVTAYNFAPDAIPKSLQECGFALMYTQSSNLLKSTSFHFAAQQGQIPIALKEKEADAHLLGGKHYIWYRPNELDPVLAQVRQIDQLVAMSEAVLAAHEQQFCWSSIAEKWRRILLQNSRS
jgi:hypothetical protein